MRFNQWRIQQPGNIVQIEFTREQAVEVLKHFTKVLKEKDKAKFFVMSFEPDETKGDTHIDK